MLSVTLATLGVITVSQDYEALLQVHDDSVVVEVQFATLGTSDVRIMLRAGQTIRFMSRLAQADSTAGVVRVRVPGSLPLRYVVAGELRRIPLPVPVTPMPQDQRLARVSILGLPPESRVERAFPRMYWVGDTARGDLRDVPSFVRVVGGTGWGVAQWSEVFVVALVLGASLLWYRRRARP